MNTWDLFFLFPGRVYFGFLVTGLQTDKEPYRAKVPSLFLEPPALIPNFAYECQYFF